VASLNATTNDADGSNDENATVAAGTHPGELIKSDHEATRSQE